MTFSIRARLSAMMFVTYVIWGAWYFALSGIRVAQARPGRPGRAKSV